MVNLAMKNNLACLVVSLACVAAPSYALAQETQEDPRDVKVLENYSPLELTTAGVGTVGALVLIGWGSDIFGHPAPGMGPPSEESVDWRFTHWVNPTPDPEKQWLGGVPDLGGYILPAGTLAFYATGSIGNAVNPNFALGSQTHELIAFTESFAWTMVAVNGLKLMVGRTRPFAVRDDIDSEAVGEDEKEQYLSFPSGHSASAAATAFFIFHDLSDHLVHRTFADSHPALRYGVGYALPLAGALGATGTVMYSRIKDQRHWLSDTLVGAFIGGSLATVFYTMHFDEEGNPRRRRALSSPEEVVSDGEEANMTFHLAPVMAPQMPMGLSFGMTF